MNLIGLRHYLNDTKKAFFHHYFFAERSVFEGKAWLIGIIIRNFIYINCPPCVCVETIKRSKRTAHKRYLHYKIERLSFDFLPKIVLIFGSLGNFSQSNGLFYVPVLSSTYISRAYFRDGFSLSNVDSAYYAKIEGNVMSWYISQAYPERQFNSSYTTYQYFTIG